MVGLFFDLVGQAVDGFLSWDLSNKTKNPGSPRPVSNAPRKVERVSPHRNISRRSGGVHYHEHKHVHIHCNRMCKCMLRRNPRSEG